MNDELLKHERMNWMGMNFSSVHALKHKAKAEYAWDEEPSKAWYNRRSIDRHKAGVAPFSGWRQAVGFGRPWTFGWSVWKVEACLRGGYHWKVVFAWQILQDFENDLEDHGRRKFLKVRMAVIFWDWKVRRFHSGARFWRGIWGFEGFRNVLGVSLKCSGRLRQCGNFRRVPQCSSCREFISYVLTNEMPPVGDA